MLPAPGDIQAKGHNVEATKTEPDKNTYLVLEDQHGADPHYDYGTHFLFQGHEGGSADPVSSVRRGYVTRVNLDADGAHRVTLLADHDANGQPLPTIDGSTWYPWSKRLLFTAENGKNGGVWLATPDSVQGRGHLRGLGRGGYEGIQADSDGNLWIVEDVGGALSASGHVSRRTRSMAPGSSRSRSAAEATRNLNNWLITLISHRSALLLMRFYVEYNRWPS